MRLPTSKGESMCVAGNYQKTTKNKSYKAFRGFSMDGSALCAVYQTMTWRGPVKLDHLGVSEHTGGNYGLHAVRSLAKAKHYGEVQAEIRAEGKVAVFRGGFLSSKQRLVRLFVPRYLDSHDLAALRKRYKVPVVYRTKR